MVGLMLHVRMHQNNVFCIALIIVKYMSICFERELCDWIQRYETCFDRFIL